MKEELSIDIIGLAGACSYALDCIEAELVNIKAWKKSGLYMCMHG